ncbi:N-acetyl-gamma-glutamyl-phosphate reductase [uncultured Clostridium sp.]|jgi:N-acetyl-gamma-glutamyl-phosphate reductase|uniref:N-acetyl-gamma-glutamyl-phosphate reductase n=1 Tax=uncultured Clostridium sp. TaxID=59620 RepID=UPI0026020049|nr:N-acetyl-gamma-glutamyl-phosphate reductase [uncultured Clostridium sp.]
MVKVGIIGATGYVGIELLSYLLRHQKVQVVGISSKSFKDMKISDIYKNLLKISDLICEDEDAVIEKSEVIFAALPHGLSEKIASKLIDSKKVLIDIGADFRLSDEGDYIKYYNKKYSDKELHKKAIYCIPELHREKVNKQMIIANPGCYPTSISLGLGPAITNDIIVENSIIIDAKSGVTGAGKVANDNTHYVDCNENLKPYALGGTHRHTPEIEEVLSSLSDRKYQITFTPHLIPVNRGILSTIYFNLKINISVEAIYKKYCEYYKNEKFIVILPVGDVANIKLARNSNYCYISIHKDERCNRCIIVSTIDNMVKGAAGQAIQNMNLRFGFDEDMGIDMIPKIF